MPIPLRPDFDAMRLRGLALSTANVVVILITLWVGSATVSRRVDDRV